jgi:hypothetical protein
MCLLVPRLGAFNQVGGKTKKPLRAAWQTVCKRYSAGNLCLMEDWHLSNTPARKERRHTYKSQSLVEDAQQPGDQHRRRRRRSVQQELCNGGSDLQRCTYTHSDPAMGRPAGIILTYHSTSLSLLGSLNIYCNKPARSSIPTLFSLVTHPPARTPPPSFFGFPSATQPALRYSSSSSRALLAWDGGSGKGRPRGLHR